MKEYLTTLDLALWLALIVGELFLCVCILKKQVVRRLPGFSAFVFGCMAENFLLLAIAFLASYKIYYYVFYVTGHLVSLLALLTLIECGRQILPGLRLPEKEKAFAWLLVALSGVVVFVAFWRLNFIENRIAVGGYLAGAVTFIFVAAYSRYLGLYWSRFLAGVAATLGMLYLVEGVVRAMAAYYPPALVAQVREISQIANLLAVISWIVVILSPWGEYRLTPDQLRALQRNVDEIEANLRDFAEEAEKVA